MELEGELGGEILSMLDDVRWRFVDSPIMVDACASTEIPRLASSLNFSRVFFSPRSSWRKVDIAESL